MTSWFRLEETTHSDQVDYDTASLPDPNVDQNCQPLPNGNVHVTLHRVIDLSLLLWNHVNINRLELSFESWMSQLTSKVWFCRYFKYCISFEQFQTFVTVLSLILKAVFCLSNLINLQESDRYTKLFYAFENLPLLRRHEIKKNISILLKLFNRTWKMPGE